MSNPTSAGERLYNSHKAMIREKSLFCKLIKVKTSSKNMFEGFMSQFKVHQVCCPYCHSTGNCVIDGDYERNLIDFIRGKTVYTQVQVCRVKCTSCGETHAILPDFIIPYNQYSLFFILRALGEYLCRPLTVSQLCERFAISESMLYRWKNLFCQQKVLWLGVIADLEISNRAFLKQLCTDAMPSDYLQSFYRLTSLSFLQNHANPTVHRRRR